MVVDARSFGKGGNLVHADVLRQTNGHQVAGFFNSLAQRHQPVKLFGIVFRFPAFLSGSLVKHKRCVQNQIRRRITVFQRGQINKRLKGRAGLTISLGGPIKLRFAERIAADDSQHFSGVRIHHNQSAFDIGKLPQFISIGSQIF